MKGQRVAQLIFALIGIVPLLPAKGGQVVLTSDPAGSTIYLDAVKVGTTPLVLNLVNGLPVKITSRFGTLAPIEQTVIPEENDLSYRFCHLYGIFVVSSDRTDAALAIDGVDFGRPPSLLFLPPGQHKLVIRAPNAPDKTRTFEVEAGYRTSVEINFSGSSPETKIEQERRPSGSPLPSPVPEHEKPAPGIYALAEARLHG
jgi:hypothetical protein